MAADGEAGRFSDDGPGPRAAPRIVTAIGDVLQAIAGTGCVLLLARPPIVRGRRPAASKRRNGDGTQGQLRHRRRARRRHRPRGLRRGDRGPRGRLRQRAEARLPRAPGRGRDLPGDRHGLPGVTHPDGTEAGLDFGLQLRFRLDLYANIRPIKLLPGIVSPLRRFEPGQIDYVILRENTEGLYAARGGGNLLRDEIASDTLIITRKGTERIVRAAFELARKRNGAPRDGRSRVTVCDKANVLRSYAFFRKVATEVAAGYPEIELDFALADAMTAHLINRPDFYDVIVTENMFGDIISDQGAATVGSMGMSPTGEVGERNGFFQAAHGSAPDIAGQGVANPIGTVLAAVLMLDWLGERHGDEVLQGTARRIEGAVGRVLAEGQRLTPDLGGRGTTGEVTRAVIAAL